MTGKDANTFRGSFYLKIIDCADLDDGRMMHDDDKQKTQHRTTNIIGDDDGGFEIERERERERIQ
jgi:hypothetical protein